MMVSEKQYSFNSQAVSTVQCESNDVLVFDCADAYSNLIQSEDFDYGQFLEKLNPVSGPVKVMNAEKGDVLKVEILKIEEAEKGIYIVKRSPFKSAVSLEKDQVNQVTLNREEKTFDFLNQKHPYSVSVGTIGVSPIQGNFSTLVCSNHGGCMETSVLTEGSMVYLPVFQSGALLSMGNLCVGLQNGKISGSCISVAGKVTVRVSVLKNQSIFNPQIETAEMIYTVGSANTLELASEIAVKAMVAKLSKRGLEAVEIKKRMGLFSSVEINQMVQSFVSVRCGYPIKAL